MERLFDVTSSRHDVSYEMSEGLAWLLINPREVTPKESVP